MLEGIAETDGARGSPVSIYPFEQPCPKRCFIVHRRWPPTPTSAQVLRALYYHSTPWGPHSQRFRRGASCAGHRKMAQAGAFGRGSVNLDRLFRRPHCFGHGGCAQLDCSHRGHTASLPLNDSYRRPRPGLDESICCHKHQKPGSFPH